MFYPKRIVLCIKIIRESGLPYAFRTTVVPELVEIKDIKEMGKIINVKERR